MRCDQIRDRIGPLIDGELAPADRQVVAAHAAGCPECARYRDELERLRAQLRPVREPAPRALAGRVRASLAVEASAPAAPRESGPQAAGMIGRVGRYLQSHARQIAAVAVACFLSIAGTAFVMQRIGWQDQLARDVLAAHVRSLLQDNAVQVASRDTHTVKPWFAGRLEFTPIVKDLSAEGFQLVGGRLDVVGGHRVAALVYRRRLHQISVFIWPAGDAPIAAASTVINGYHLVAWSKAGMSIWAVSDLNAAELRELQTLL